MLKYLPLCIGVLLFVGSLSFISIATSDEKGFRDRLFDFIDSTSSLENTENIISEPDETSIVEGMRSRLQYEKGDWGSYIIDPRYKIYEKDEAIQVVYDYNRDVNITTYGDYNLNIIYGDSIFTKDRYQSFEEDEAASQVLKSGFRGEQNFKLHMEGSVGDRLKVFIDHDSERKDNRYKIQYRAMRDDEVIQELNAGEIDIKFNHSKYAVYDNTTSKGMGVDLTLKKNNFQLKAFGSIARGETVVEQFRGNTRPGNVKLLEAQFLKKSYYQLEPYKRYDNLSSPPSGASAYNLVVFTSAPSNPQSYRPYPVNINPSGFELYMDDQNPDTVTDTVRLSIDNGLYAKLRSGVDYSINYTTGVITFLTDIPDKARIFAVYNLLGGSSSDPAVVAPGDSKHPGGIFTGKNIVFIKYGYSLDEDTVVKNLSFDAGEVDRNNDGKVNPDAYEIRSYYFVGERNLLSDSLRITFMRENAVMTKSEILDLGQYGVRYSSGIIEFYLREPFKPLLDANTAERIYAENQTQAVYQYSRYRIMVDYYSESRSFKLGHFNIIPDSVRIKVNQREISENLYTIDYTGGFLTFQNPNNPLIGPDTVIEVRYEFIPFGAQSRSFVGGLRADYNINDTINFGSSLLYARSASTETIPDPGVEPTQTILVEGDAKVDLDGEFLAKVLNRLSSRTIRNVPVNIKGYAEYARSYKNVNTFGKALLDNMESADEVAFISLGEKDWMLSSEPASVAVTRRSLLNYYYYRDPATGSVLQNLLYPAPKILYSVKPGPFNVSYGHDIGNQNSLVLDFDSEGDFVSIVTRQLSEGAVDFSELQYVEISYLYDGTGDVELYLDLGSVNEDGDGDGIFDTEDVNRNNVLDRDPVAGYSEDIGFEFNDPFNKTRVGGGPNINALTRGNGILDSEDINRNGVLDTVENVYTVPDSSRTLPGNDPRWKKKRIFIDRSTITNSEIDLLKQVEAVRLSLVKAAGVSGRIYIDDIRFVSSKWKELEIDGNTAAPAEIQVALIDSLSDDEYKKEPFHFIQKDLYKSLYGDKSNSDLLLEKETALEIAYDISSGSYVSATRRFSKPVDMRYYKTINLWMNYRNFTDGDSVGFIIGSSDNDYIEFRFPMDLARFWREVKFRLKQDSGGEVFANKIVGQPDLKRINFMEIRVYAPGRSGRLWLNEIYLSEAEVVSDEAHWYEGEIAITKPLFRTKTGVPVLSDISIKYVQKGHGASFDSVGKTSSDIAEEYKQVFTSMSILPNWTTYLDFTREESKTDSLNENVLDTKRGSSFRDVVYLVSDYDSRRNAVPSLKIAYKYDKYENDLDERISTIAMKRYTRNTAHSPLFNVTEKIDKFLWGRLDASLDINLYFKDETIERLTGLVDLETLSTYTSLKERDKRQKSQLNLDISYSNKYFYFNPQMEIDSEEIVRMYGKSELNQTEVKYAVNGDYHFPFIYNKDCKFVSRGKRFTAALGLERRFMVSPEYRIEIQYNENGFRDYDAEEVPYYEFQRSRDVRSQVSTEIAVPFNLSKIKKLNNIKSVNFIYKRTLNLIEKGVPFEGEQSRFLDEQFGPGRSLKGITDAGLNIFTYYPFYFYGGRKNSANARDYVLHKLNRPIYFANGDTVIEYSNQLRLVDDFSSNMTVDLFKVSINLNGGINQVCERMDLWGIPQQIINGYCHVDVSMELMQIFGINPYTPIKPKPDDLKKGERKKKEKYRSAFLNLGYRFNRNMIITSNIEEDSHNPMLSFTFKWGRANLGLKFGMDLKYKRFKPYIPYNSFTRSNKDNIYIENMPQFTVYRQSDIGYSFKLAYETDVKWLYDLFSKLYRLVAYPIFFFEYAMELNRSSYELTTEPEPYDQHLFTIKLDMDLHKNVRGGFHSRLSLEQFRNRESWNVSKEIFSYEVGLNFSLLF